MQQTGLWHEVITLPSSMVLEHLTSHEADLVWIYLDSERENIQMKFFI